MASLEGLRDSPPPPGFLPAQSVMNTLCWVSPRLFTQPVPSTPSFPGCSTADAPAQAGPTELTSSRPCSLQQGCEPALPERMHPHPGSDLPSSISPGNQSAWTVISLKS